MKNVAFVAILFFGGCAVKDDGLLTLQGFNPCGVTPPPGIPAPTADDFDTVLPSGWYIDFELKQPVPMSGEPHTYEIEWGSAHYGNLGKLTTPECMNDDCPYSYAGEFDRYIGLRRSCLMAFWSLSLLPKRKQDTIIILNCDLQHDTKRGYIMAAHCDNEDSSDFCLFDANTLAHHPIKLPDLPETGFMSTRLDTITFIDGGVRIAWNSTDDYGNVQGMRDTVIMMK